MKKYIDFRKILFIFIFLAGLAIMFFPIVSQFYYYHASHQKINDFKEGVSKLTPDEINHRIELAKAYNTSLLSAEITLIDPYSDAQKAKGRREYGRMLEVNEQIGHITIPQISQDLPIYVGTSEQVLQKGVGHLEGTSLPIGGENTHAILSAHRGLPNAQLFTNLDKMKEGDIFYIHNLKETLAYQVDQISVIEPTELEKLTIIPGKDYVTLLTCTPYMVNSHRLLVRGYRIPYDKKIEEELLHESTHSFYIYVIIAVSIFILLLMLLFILLRRRKHDK
ncbi:class C sortase [Gemella cuniculi]|uniref:class C sortase n=1 Tax=Gemella cuniculi TaxID=150240 RepID=UPI000404D874|nr:class C sortase [Gemella cuniculi]